MVGQAKSTSAVVMYHEANAAYKFTYRTQIYISLARSFDSITYCTIRKLNEIAFVKSVEINVHELGTISAIFLAMPWFKNQIFDGCVTGQVEKNIHVMLKGVKAPGLIW